MREVLVICGATATGKTALAVECAKKLGTEIISADSQLVYKGLNVGTAKPDSSEMGGVVHHMIDVAEPAQNFSVVDYADMARPILNNLLSSGKVPIICGGTGFYINSLLFDYSYGGTGANSEIRQKYNDILKEKGKEYLYSLLKEKDFKSYQKLHVNDVKRVIRALEIAETGVKKSDFNDELKPKYNYLAVAIDFDRAELYERIDGRVDEMFRRGLVDEVKNLLSRGIDEKYQCMQAIGYKEVLFCLNNGDNESTMRDIIKQSTRHYAKRQITFFKKLKGIKWLKAEEVSADLIAELLANG